MSCEWQMIVKARQKVMESSTWLTPSELASLAGASTFAMKIQLSEWKSANQIFSVFNDHIELFPAYIFHQNKLQPLAQLFPILTLFLNKKDDWGVAYWFAGANGFLGGERPQNIIRVDPYRVWLAAKDELLGVTHG
ncbi:MAG: hypothetical protein EOO53_01880 [Gammaproteobacteria bacterium]|nr:MAG: hypothetical protein EOO53_01880 [Gammaproteobacteria bacterium]